MAQFVEGLAAARILWHTAELIQFGSPQSPSPTLFFLLTFSLLGLQAFQYNPSLACSVSGSISIGYPLSHSRRSIAIGGINWLPLEHVSNVDNPSSDNGADTYYTPSN